MLQAPGQPIGYAARPGSGLRRMGYTSGKGVLIHVECHPKYAAVYAHIGNRVALSNAPAKPLHISRGFLF